MPHPLVPMPGHASFCQGMNAYWTRYGLPRPSTLDVCVWYPQYTGWPVAIVRGGVRMMYVACGSYLKCFEARTASAAIGSSERFCASPDAMMSDGTGAGSVQAPFNWGVGFVTNPLPPTQLVEPTRMTLQYCVWMFAHELPPTLWKNALT